MSPFQPGDVIGGRYRLLRVMGAGAMGVVWSARNESTERDFAIKLMTPESAKDPQRLQRFFKEAKLAGRLRHRCIVEVYDLGRIDEGPHEGSPYLVMELLEGEPLDALLRRTGKLPAGTALRIVREVARGLEVAHAQSIVHRDLKPANVFLHRTLEGFTVPKILDFGISKLMSEPKRGRFDPQETTVGTILGSPAYMSPEQTSGEDLDPRADIWSLGVMLYKMLSGALPFVASNFASLMLSINTKDPKPLVERVPGLPDEVYALVARCLSRRRGERFASAGALADAIDGILAAHELPVLELSQVVGDGAAVPSEHMKTLRVGATSASISISLDTAPSAETAPLLETRPLDETRAVSADVSGAVQALEPGRASAARRRALSVGALAVGMALLALVAVKLRAPAVPVASTTASPKPVVVASPPKIEEHVASVMAPPIEAAPKPSIGDKPKPSPKVPPAKPKSSSVAPHHGLVRPGF